MRRGRTGRATWYWAGALLLGAPLADGQSPLGTLFQVPEGKARRVTSASRDPSSNLDYIPLAAGAEITLADLKGPGCITHFWLTAESDDPYWGRLVVLRARWDHETTPSIEVPVGDFFAVGHALDANVNTEPVRVTGDGRGRACFWPMPFNEAALITLRNDSPRALRLVFWRIDWTEGASKGGRTLHAHFRTARGDPNARFYKVAEIQGSGHYVGTVLSIQSGEAGWPGEGDDRFYVNGAEQPTLQGTGLEDYFGQAFGFEVGQGPYGGVTVFEGTGAGARLTACRWHLRDPIPFEKALVVAFERMGSAQRGDEWQVVTDRKDAWSSVAFWYQQEPHGLLTVLPAPGERLPFFEVRLEPEERELFKLLEVPEEAAAPQVQRGGFWAYGAQVSFTPKNLDHGQLALPFDVPGPREYDLFIRLTRTLDGGVWQVFLDEEPLCAPIDLHAKRTLLHEVLLGRRHLKPGGHRLELRCTGRNLESQGLAVGVDSFMVRWYP